MNLLGGLEGTSGVLLLGLVLWIRLTRFGHRDVIAVDNFLDQNCLLVELKGKIRREGQLLGKELIPAKLGRDVQHQLGKTSFGLVDVLPLCVNFDSKLG